MVVGRVLEMLGSREVSVNEIWPCVPWAPSHPFHVMPPRITRNSYSHEPRIEPWLTLSRHSLVALANSTAPLTHQRTLTRMANQTSLAKQNYSGLDLEKKSRLRLRAKFFLDIPFNRTY